MTPPLRPRPLLDAMTSGGTWITTVGTLAAAGVSIGILTTSQANLVNYVAAVVVSLAPLVTSVLVQYHILHTVEPLVTPVADPQTADGTPLVPQE